MTVFVCTAIHSNFNAGGFKISKIKKMNRNSSTEMRKKVMNKKRTFESVRIQIPIRVNVVCWIVKNRLDS